MSSFVNSNYISNYSAGGELVNYRPYASPLFEVAKPLKVTATSVIKIIIIFTVLNRLNFNCVYKTYVLYKEPEMNKSH